jgi:hypothetical protein
MLLPLSVVGNLSFAIRQSILSATWQDPDSEVHRRGCFYGFVTDGLQSRFWMPVSG